MFMICKLERVVEEIREAVKEVREHHGKRHRQYMDSMTQGVRPLRNICVPDVIALM